MSGLGNLFQNKLFLQYLAGAGQDLMSGKPGNVNAITQQNIQSQNLMKMLKQMLGPDGTKGTFDNTGMTLKVPTESISDTLQGTGQGGVWEGMAPPWNPAATTNAGNATPAQALKSIPGMGGASTINPFESSQPINPADLAGLTSQDIMSAMGVKLHKDELERKSINDVMDMVYKTATLNKEKDTAEMKNYEYAVKDGFKGTFMEFKDAAKTEHMKDYEGALKGGYKGSFDQWMLDMRKAGATRITLGEKVEEKKAMSELGGQLYFNNPKWTEDLGKHLSSEDVQNVLFRSDNPKQERAAETVKFVEGKIVAGGGTIQNVKWDTDGRTMVWTVKWPSGDTKVIKQAVK